MAGSVAIDDIETSEAAPEISEETPEINAEQVVPEEKIAPEEEVIPDAKEEILGEEKTEGKGTEALPEDTIKVGDKAYTKEQATELLGKIGRYQGDRDRAEATLEKFARQISQQGFEIGQDLSIKPRAIQPQVDKNQLAEKAVMGDTQALQQLLHMQSQEVAQNITHGLKEERALDNIYKDVLDKYPDFYVKGEDGKVARDRMGNPIANQERPLFTEALSVMEQYPGLANPYALPVLADMAEHRLLRKNLPKVEQQAKDKALQKNKINRSMASPSSTPSPQVEKTTLSPEVMSVATKLGSSADRISKIVERAQKQGGYYL